MKIKRKGASLTFTLIFSALVPLCVNSLYANQKTECPAADDPPPTVIKVNLTDLTSSLENLKDTQNRSLWTTTEESKKNLSHIFESTPQKTKLEQFFQLLYLIQKNIPESNLPIVVSSEGVSKVLLTAKVFTDDAFPKKITSVKLKQLRHNSTPYYELNFSESEVRFPINAGKGFTTWEQGMCQVARELVFYPGFSFHLRQARNSDNLVVDAFDKVQIFGNFGSRKLFDIDLSYVDLEKVEFIEGTDRGKVKSRIAKREFETNKHSGFFKFVGTLIPNTSEQRIDW